ELASNSTTGRMLRVSGILKADGKGAKRQARREPVGAQERKFAVRTAIFPTSGLPLRAVEQFVRRVRTGTRPGASAAGNRLHGKLGVGREFAEQVDRPLEFSPARDLQLADLELAHAVGDGWDFPLHVFEAVDGLHHVVRT